MYSVQCTLYMYIVQCTLYNVHMKFSFRGTTVFEVKKYKFLNVSASASRCNIFVSSLQEQVYQHFMESKNSSYLLTFMRLDLVFAGIIMATKLENKSMQLAAISGKEIEKKYHQQVSPIPDSIS